MDAMVELLEQIGKEVEAAYEMLIDDDSGIFKQAGSEGFEKNVIVSPMVFSDENMARVTDMSTPDGVHAMELATLIKDAFGG